MSLAARGARETDGGTESIDDAALADALRRRARQVWIRTFLATAATVGAAAILRAAGGP